MNIIKMPCFDMDKRDTANYYAQLELNDAYSLFELMKQSFGNTILFKDLNIDKLEEEIVNEVRDKFFYKDGIIKDEYINTVCEKYNQNLL